MRIEIKAVDPIALNPNIRPSSWLKDGSLQVLVPDYGRNYDGAFLVALYEVVDAWQCRKLHLKAENLRGEMNAFADAIEKKPHVRLKSIGSSTKVGREFVRRSRS